MTRGSMLLSGVFDLPSWGYVVVALVLTHITIVAVTVFLHRHQAHHALGLHPVASHFFRLWLWLTTDMKTRDWAAIHRKHHAKCETAEDPQPAGARHQPSAVGRGDSVRVHGELILRPRWASGIGRGNAAATRSTESTNRLLRVMIALLLRRDGEQALTVKQQIETLHRLNVRSTEIAQILGRTPTHVNKELTGLRKAR